MTIYYLITEQCNLNCSHCIRGKSNVEYMDVTKACNGLEEIKEVFPNATIVISGGEPTLHPEFDIILNTAMLLFERVAINSNGTTDFYKKYHDKYKKLCIQFSLDGDQEFHDSMRGNGTFMKVMESIHHLNSKGHTVWISSVVTKKNIESIKRLPEILSRYNIGKWHVSPVMPFGNASWEDVLPTDMWNSLVDDLILKTPFRLGIRKLFDFTRLELLTDEQIDQIAQSLRNQEYKNCGCIRNKLYVYPDMGVYACTCVKDDILGYMDKENIAEIVKNRSAQKYLDFYADNEVCIKCRYHKICNGGCVGLYKKYGFDIRCPQIKKKYEKNFLL